MSWEGGLFRPGFPKTESFENPYNTLPPLPGDFTPFHVTIAVCTIVFAFILILNLVCCCSERYKNYWRNPHTGNRLILSLWISSPKYQPPLDVWKKNWRCSMFGGQLLLLWLSLSLLLSSLSFAMGKQFLPDCVAPNLGGILVAAVVQSWRWWLTTTVSMFQRRSLQYEKKIIVVPSI